MSASAPLGGSAFDGRGSSPARRFGRPHVTLKLALSLDGAVAVAMASGSSQWITGPEARAHAHLERARHDAILVGRGTLEADAPALYVRLAGLEDRSPKRRVVHEPAIAAAPRRLTAPPSLASPGDIADA